MEIEVKFTFTKVGHLSSVEFVCKNGKHKLVVAINKNPLLLLIIDTLFVAIIGKEEQERSDKEANTQVESNVEEIPSASTKSIQILNSSAPHELSHLLQSVEEGFDADFDPELCDEGVNGTYFLKDKNGKRIAVFKPQDEEGNSHKNPKRRQDDDENLSKGLLEGEAALREVAAYLIDKKGNHFSKVPKTQLVKISHKSFEEDKIGSLQEFIENEGSCEEMPIPTFPAKEVHRIGVLDLQLLNMDRHSGNILVQKKDGKCELVPIDHGFSMPDESALGNSWFDWLTWSQAKEDFDEETLKYIDNIDLEANSKMLEKELGVRKECLRSMWISTTLLKKGAKLGLTLYDIGCMACRETLDQPSQLELMVEEAKSMTDTEENFYSCLSEVMDRHLQQLKI